MLQPLQVVAVNCNNGAFLWNSDSSQLPVVGFGSQKKMEKTQQETSVHSTYENESWHKGKALVLETAKVVKIFPRIWLG